uniref:Uncharacterized protein n=1 Tax=Lepeophtheirus salmonis TaxID=72036 RepID=A0A0K2TSA3_LEPSM
MHHVIIPSTL